MTLGALDFPVYEAVSGQPLRQTIIFFNTRDLAYKGSKYLRVLLPEASHHEINFLHTGHNRRARCKMLRDFGEEKSVFFVLLNWQEWYDKISG